MDQLTILVDQEQQSLLGLLSAVQAARGELRQSLFESFRAEWSQRSRHWEEQILPELASLSLTARFQLEALRLQHAELRDVLAEQPTDGLEVLHQRVSVHLQRERSLLLPLLRRSNCLRQAIYYTVSSRLLVVGWSTELAVQTQIAGEQVLGRPVNEVLPRLEGGVRLALVLGCAPGATVWYPPWADRIGAVEPSRIQAAVAGDYPARVRPAVETALAQLCEITGAAAAGVDLLDPHSGRLVPAFRYGAVGPDHCPAQVLDSGQPLGSEGSAWVPLRSCDDQVVGGLGVVGHAQRSRLESTMTLLLWAGTPLAHTLEPLLESLRYPGHSTLSPALCRQTLGLG